MPLLTGSCHHLKNKDNIPFIKTALEWGNTKLCYSVIENTSKMILNTLVELPQKLELHVFLPNVFISWLHNVLRTENEAVIK
jgi:hypothetical protein